MSTHHGFVVTAAERGRARTPSAPRLRGVVAIGRPLLWPVSLLPFYCGVVLATHRLIPTVADLPDAVVGAVVAGPLVWVAVLALNDVHDLPGDLRNPRKCTAPLVTGRLTPADARAVTAIAAVLAVLTALVVGTTFAAGTVLMLGLGWAYSAPPLRWKTRPGIDVAVNAAAVGMLGPLAGWTAVHGIIGFPWLMAAQGALVGVALYVPTTLADLGADVRSGYRTVAVALGARRAYLLGFACWVAAAVASVWLAYDGAVIPRRMLAFEVVLVPVLVPAYHLLLAKRQTFARIVAVASLFLAPSGLFVLTYVGLIGSAHG